MWSVVIDLVSLIYYLVYFLLFVDEYLMIDLLFYVFIFIVVYVLLDNYKWKLKFVKINMFKWKLVIWLGKFELKVELKVVN